MSAENPGNVEFLTNPENGENWLYPDALQVHGALQLFQLGEATLLGIGYKEYTEGLGEGYDGWDDEWTWEPFPALGLTIATAAQFAPGDPVVKTLKQVVVTYLPRDWNAVYLRLVERETWPDASVHNFNVHEIRKQGAPAPVMSSAVQSGSPETWLDTGFQLQADFPYFNESVITTWPATFQRVLLPTWPAGINVTPPLESQTAGNFLNTLPLPLPEHYDYRNRFETFTRRGLRVTVPSH